MDNQIIKIGIAIVGILIFIYAIKNIKEIVKLIEKYKEKKIIKYIFYIILIVICIYFVYFVNSQIKLLTKNFEWYKTSIENDLMYEKYDELIAKESKYYNEKINLNYENERFDEPYIPEGFSFFEGDWNSGFVIQDENQNQYVWVPCTNLDNRDIPKLERKNLSEQAFISKDLCNNDEYEEFIQSALENGGFYISRFEIGKENEKPVSKKDTEVWTDVTRDEANNIVKSMYDNINCELMNGYAFDTTLSWILKNNDIKVDMINFDKKVISGRMSHKNIYDIMDNVMEITSETTYSNVIIRGASFESLEDLPVDYGYNINNFDRFSIKENENFFTNTTKLAFRTILYK